MVRTYGLTHLSMTVRDVEKSYQFYRAVFGVEEYYREAGQIQAKTPGAHDVLVFNEGTADVGNSGGIAHFGFRLVDPADITAAIEAVERSGGTILSRGDFSAGEPYAFVTDPDGYQVEIWYE
jgi:catechol 2,3-dioxygenase-like lactoylglutathione lyase family enzyme